MRAALSATRKSAKSQELLPVTAATAVAATHSATVASATAKRNGMPATNPAASVETAHSSMSSTERIIPATRYPETPAPGSETADITAVAIAVKSPAAVTVVPIPAIVPSTPVISPVTVA